MKTHQEILRNTITRDGNFQTACQRYAHQCASAGVPFFFKQWGEWAPGEIAGEFLNPERAAKGLSLFDNRWSECWSEVDGHCDDEPDVYRIGKTRAGRLLDGIEHDGMPVQP